jgi:hypothetical protein
VALGQVFSENFGFPCQSTFHLLLHNHLHYHPRLAQYPKSGRSANSLTNQIIKKIKLNKRRFCNVQIVLTVRSDGAKSEHYILFEDGQNSY